MTAVAPFQIQLRATLAPAAPTGPLAPTPIEQVHALLPALDRKLLAMERFPAMFAVAPEALAALFLHVVETRQRLLRPRAHLANPRETLDAWITFGAFVAGNGPVVSPFYATLAEHGRLAELPRLLGDAARWIAQEHPPEGRSIRAPGAHRVLWTPFPAPRCLDCDTKTTFLPGRGQVWRAPKTTRWSRTMPPCSRPKGPSRAKTTTG